MTETWLCNLYKMLSDNFHNDCSQRLLWLSGRGNAGIFHVQKNNEIKQISLKDWEASTSYYSDFFSKEEC